MEDTDHLLNLYTEISVAVTNAIEGIREDIRKELLAEDKQSPTQSNYAVGDFVYFEYRGKVTLSKITSVIQAINNANKFCYIIEEFGCFDDTELHSSPQSLAEERIKYWKKILIEC